MFRARKSNRQRAPAERNVHCVFDSHSALNGAGNQGNRGLLTFCSPEQKTSRNEVTFCAKASRLPI